MSDTLYKILLKFKEYQNINRKLYKSKYKYYYLEQVKNKYGKLIEYKIIEGKNYFQSLINNNYVILAILDEEIVGYLAGSINEQGSYEEIQYGEINNMFIKDTCRGFGIGKKLISCFKEYCRQNNIYTLKVTASFKNKNAIEFYRKNGFLEFDLTLTTNIDKEDKNDF